MIQDSLEDYIDVLVGNAKKIDPEYLIEEKFDCLIIGDVINEEISSSEIQNWLLKYKEISNKYNLIIKAVSGFYVATADIKTELLWIESLQEYINAEMIYPPILSLRLNKTELALEDGALEIVKEYSKDFIRFFIDNKKKE